MQPTPLFDELHVISDLHLGGATGRQIFDQGATAAALIQQLAAPPAKRKIGLVINGDLVDFLAEPAAIWFDPDGAVSRLERIVADPAFSPVFEALNEFVKKPGRQLVITLGNHDLELALPWVRERFLEILSGGNDAARSRITLAFDGAGYRCQVGSATILCVHGNEVDEWNVTDHEQIRRIGRDVVQGRTFEPWKPNAGARMVIEVMNDIKREYPFVDLLKPEFQAAVPALLVIKPALAGKIADVGRLALRLNWDGLKMRFGFLSAAGENGDGGPNAPPRTRGGEPSAEVVLRQLLGSAASGFGGPRNQTAHAADLLARAEEHMKDKRLPLELISGATQDAQLGMMDAAWGRLTGRSDSEVLRAALESVQKDRSFDLAAPDDTFKRLDALIGAELRYVVSGHTHLRRALNRTRGNGFYYNTGTWARLLGLTTEQLRNDEDFRKVFDALKAPTLAELDQTPFLSRQPTAACFESDGATTRGSLREYQLTPDGKLKAITLEGSLFPPP
jgi:UDP-2,3-diacylglucosamine pyrophosphatase LpxH